MESESGFGEDEARALRDAPVRAIDNRDGTLVVRLAGELDLHNAPVVREALLAATEERPERLVVDLAGVSFIDSTLLGVLLETRGRFDRRESFVLAAPRDEARRTLSVSGLDQHFMLRETVDAALAGEG